MTTFKAIPAALLLAAVALPAAAQTGGMIQSVEGDAVIERGGELFAATSLSAVAPGDAIFTYDDASANIVLENGCALSLTENQSTKIVSAETCEASFQAVAAEDFVSLDQISGGLAALSTSQIVAGIAIATAAVVVASETVFEDDDDAVPPNNGGNPPPVSP